LAKTAGLPTTIANDISGGAAGQVVYQTGLNQTGFTATGTSGELLQSGGIGTPTWIGPNNLSVTSTGSTTARTLANRFADVVNVKDFGAIGNGITDDTNAFIDASISATSSKTNGTVVAPNGDYIGRLPSVANKNVLYVQTNGPDADLVINGTGERGGYYSDWDNKAGEVKINQINENQSSVTTGAFRDLSYLQVVDTDTTNYTTVAQKVTNGIRSFVQGANNGSIYIPQYKDLVGSYFVSIGNIQWSSRGCSAVTADALQMGIGICSNEFAVHNPSPAAGGQGQSVSMAAVQPIVKNQYADEDSTHTSYGILVTSIGKRVTAAFGVNSSLYEGNLSEYKYGLQLDGAKITGAGIVMSSSATSNAGSVIQYDNNCYSAYLKTEQLFTWAVNGNGGASVSEYGISVGEIIKANTRIYISPSTSTLSHIRLASGADVSAPANGDMWFNGSALKIRIGGVTRTVNVT
jgi:hypothetical protein